MMQIDSASRIPFFPERQQATPVDRQIEKLEQRKQKLEQDARAPGSNSDPLAARGERDANRDFNRSEIQKLEAQIAALRSRQNTEERQSSGARAEEPQAAAAGGFGTLGRYVDEFV